MASKYIDIPYNLVTGATLVTDADMLLQKLRLLLLTEPTEFIDIPTWGTPLRQYLYEIMGMNDEFIRMAVRSSLQTWMYGQIKINSITIQSNTEEQSISIIMDLYLIEFDKNVEYVVERKAA